MTINSSQRAAFAGPVSTPHGKFEVSVTPFSGWFDHPRGNGILTTNVTNTSPQYSFAIPYIPQKTITISGIGAYTGTAVASATCSLAIYASGADGWPSGTAAMHCSAALTASAATTAISSSYSATLYAGTQYWLVYNTPNSSFPSMRGYGSTALPRLKMTGTDTNPYYYITWAQNIATSRNFTTTPVTSSETFGGLVICIVYVIVA